MLTRTFSSSPLIYWLFGDAEGVGLPKQTRSGAPQGWPFPPIAPDGPKRVVSQPTSGFFVIL